MRLTQAELESQLDWRRDLETRRTDCHPHALKEVATPQELEALRQMACLREVAGMREVATPREIADLRKAAATRNPQILRGLDMRGWLAAPLISRADGCGRNLGLIQLSDKYDGEFTSQDEITLGQFARIVSIAVENRLRGRHELKLRETAERAARAKDEYMAMASYKLRAQLNILLGWSWVLRRQACKMEDVARAAEIIERAARNQARLVEEILGASRKGAVIWREGGTEGRRDEEIAGWREGETGLWREGTGDEQWKKKTEEWEEGGILDLSISPSHHLTVTPSLRATVHCPPNSTSRGLAAGGGR